MKKIIYYTGLIFIAIFLFATHSKFLFVLEPEKDIALFTFFGVDFKKVIPYIFGAAFGIVTAILIGLMQKEDELFWYFAIIIAVLEMTGIFLYNNTEIVKNIWRWFASSYYAIYSGFIVFFYAYISHSDKINVISEIEYEEAEEVDPMKIGDWDMTSKPVNENAKIDAKRIRNEKILQMYATMTPQEIANEMGINKSTVYRALKQNEK